LKFIVSGVSINQSEPRRCCQFTPLVCICACACVRVRVYVCVCEPVRACV